MGLKVRFIDNLKVGAYSTTGNAGIDIIDNINNYVLTSTGGDSIQAESGVVIKDSKLSIGNLNPTANFEIFKDNNDDLLLIRNSTTLQGLRIQKEGILQLIEFSSLPSSIEGGVVYSGGNFYVGKP